MIERCSVTLSLVLLLAAFGDAQQFDRRSRDEPEVVIEAGGRVGTADALQFTPDGNFLLAAGDDKVVRVWPCTAVGLDNAPARTRVLRWRGWRDQLGGIKCLAVSPDGKFVAVGGYGLKVSSVAILDRETAATVAITWPRVREGDYHDAVTAVAFHPDGKRVGFGTADGTIWLWEPVKLDKPEGDRLWNAPLYAGRFENTQPEKLNTTHGIRFPDANTVVAVSRLGQVLACDLKQPLSDDPAVPTPQGKTLFDVNADIREKYPVHHAEWTGDGSWLVVVTKGPLVLLRSADGKVTRRLDLPRDHFPRSLAVHPKSGKIAVGVASALPGTPGRPRFYMEPDDQIWIYDEPTATKFRDPKKRPHTGRAEAMVFHPTENRLAVAGGDADEVTYLDLGAPEKPLSVIRGTGRRMYGITLNENGDVFGVRSSRNVTATDPNDRGNGIWARFNLPRFTPTADAGGNWLGPISNMNDWEIVPDAESRFVWYAERQKGEGKHERFRLVLDPDKDQAPTCYTFVPTQEGKPSRVLIGHYYGCSLFELDPGRAVKNELTGVPELPRSKLFVGHGAEVNAIVADKKGMWFLTAGGDQTVAAWSLRDWKSQAVLGADFAVKDGQLVVNTVDVGSPAWEAGLTAGDRIELVAVGGKLSYDRRAKRAPVGTADAMVAALAKPQSGEELFFGWVAGAGDRRGTPTRLKQRPMWKWFPSFDERGRITDSVLWMWHGSYYYTASVHGDRMVGWHVNAPEVAGTPDFQPLERYKQLFLRPNVITKLIATRDVVEALKEAANDNPVRRSFREVEAAPVELALKSGIVRPDGVKLTVSVSLRGNNPDMIPNRVELWVNDFRYRVWMGMGREPLKEDVEIPATTFRAGDNRITALALNPLRGRAEATAYVSNPIPPVEPRLTGVAIGINDYDSHRKAVGEAEIPGTRAFGDLRKARADATDFSRELLRYSGPGKFFSAGRIPQLLDGDAGRKGIISALTDLKEADLRPDDTVVVFFAGHGDLLAGRGTPRAFSTERSLPSDAGYFVLCCPDYSPLKSADTSVSAEEVFEVLAGLNCRKFVLLDACHSGGALETNVVRRFIPHGQGPVVIAACDQHELSYEDEKLGHGVFTYAVLEAFGSKFRAADANSDGTLTPAELYDYLADRVPSLVQNVKPGSRQNPICFPQANALPKTALIRK